MTLGSEAAGPRSGRGPAPDPDCSVVIVNYYSEALLRACLESLPSSAGPLSLEVIVVDNSGTARASGVLDAWPNARLIEAGGNVGFGRACNLGMATARGRHLLLLNPDTVAHPEAVAILSRYLDASPEAGAVAARLLNADGTLQYSCRRFPRPLSIFFGRYALLTRLFPGNPVSSDYLYLDWDHASARPVDWVSGACLMVRGGVRGGRRPRRDSFRRGHGLVPPHPRGRPRGRVRAAGGGDPSDRGQPWPRSRLGHLGAAPQHAALRPQAFRVADAAGDARRPGPRHSWRAGHPGGSVPERTARAAARDRSPPAVPGALGRGGGGPRGPAPG